MLEAEQMFVGSWALQASCQYKVESLSASHPTTCWTISTAHKWSYQLFKLPHKVQQWALLLLKLRELYYPHVNKYWPINRSCVGTQYTTV